MDTVKESIMTTHSFTLHITDESDASTISEVENRAFEYRKEADLMASLLEDESACPKLSLLHRHQGKATGHILFTQATFKGANEGPLMHILAPLAVIPEYQGMGGGIADTHRPGALEVDGKSAGFCTRPCYLLPTPWIHTLC